LHLHALLDQGVTVLTASRRLAHAVRLGYARQAQQRGASAWHTPKALPWNAWLRQQHLEARAASATGTHSRVLTPAQARVLWDSIVENSRHSRELLNPSNAARLAARSWRRLQDFRIPLERLQSFDAPEARALHAWSVEFQRRCEALGAIDEARLAEWAHDSRWAPATRIACAGFDFTPPAMALLLDRWRGLGLLVDIDPSPGAAGRETVIGAPDVAAEIELAAQWALERVQQGASRVGVIVPDLQVRRHEVRRTFEDVFAPGLRQTHAGAASIPVVLAAPTPLSEYPLVDAALLILRLVAGNGSSTDAGRLLRSPFIAGGVTERSLRALADRSLREEQRDRWDWFEIERWAARTGCDQLHVAARSLTSNLRAEATSASASEWAERFHAIWRSVGWPGERTLNSAEHQTLDKFHAVLAEFGALDAVTGRMNLRRAASHFRDLLNDTPFEPEAASAAVTVIDASTSAGMQFDALWVAGLDADSLPAPVNPDALIPLELQREAGMPDASPEGVLSQATRQLQRWRSSADEVILSWPRQESDVQLMRSPLLPQETASPVVAQTRKPASTLRRLVFEARPTLESLRDDRAPHLPPQAARGGVRTLELQSVCAFRAQAEIRLRAEPMPRVSLGVEPADRGALLHRVLEDVWGELRTQQRLLASGDEDLLAIVRESAQRHAAQLQPVTRYRSRLVALEVESAVRQVSKLLALEKLRPPFAVKLAEAPESYTLGGLSITLRPDRIDRLDSGGELLIDYKLGDSYKPGRDWLDVWPGRPRRPQLPLYGLAHAQSLRALAYVVVAAGAVEYRGWSDGADMGAGVLPYPSGVRIDLGDPQDWESLMHHWRFTLTRLAERYVAGDATLDPLPFACATCHLSTLCRIDERLLSGVDEQGIEDD
jgi:ATP-dependent helicase/nuclease subunit B